jgi:CubicO group peptidase (beta-lactamase class C family)
MVYHKLIGVLLCATVVRAAEIQPASLDRMIEATRDAWGVPGVAVAIVHGDDTVYLKGFGVRRIGASDPVTPDTLFAICSVTKTFTSAALAILADERKLQWDDPVRKHLPYFRFSDPLADAHVTLRDLLCHRTGMSGRHDFLSFNNSWSREEIVRRIGLVPLSHPFRSQFEYQNIMFIAAGEVVGRVAGTSWEEFVDRRLLQPLGMTSTSFRAPDPATARDYATPHHRLAGKLQAVEWPNFEKVAPAGGITSSVRDLTRWMRLHLNAGKFEGKVVLKEASIRETHTPQMLTRTAPNEVNEGSSFRSYGLGWYVENYRGHLVVRHPGGTTGFVSMLMLLPEERFGVAILTNLSGVGGMARSLQNLIRDELLGLSTKDLNATILAGRRQQSEPAQTQSEAREANRAKEARPSLPIKTYAGEYEDTAYGQVRIRDLGSQLEFTHNNWQALLQHEQSDTFRVASVTPAPGFAMVVLTGTRVQFRLHPNGNIESLRFLDREFFRRRSPKQE